MNFSDIEKNDKNENTIKIIMEMIKSEKIPSAFIFEGEDEENKKIISEALAKAIICQNNEYKKKNGEGCGICGACIKAQKSIHPDIIVSKSESDGNLSFHIDKARDITGGLYLAPNESERKVYIIQDMHNMTPQGQNALLKSLEEPPPFAVFIITVNNGDLILETVKSRAVKFSMDFKSKAAKKSPQQYEDIISDILSQKSDKLEIYQKLLSKAVDKSGKTEVLNFYSLLENALRDLLVAKIFTPNEFNGQNPANDLANTYSTKKILNLSKKIQKYKADLEYNINIRLNLTSFFSTMLID